MSRKIELVFAAFFALFFIGWLTFDIPVALGFVLPKGPPGTRARSTRSSAIRDKFAELGDTAMTDTTTPITSLSGQSTGGRY